MKPLFAFLLGFGVLSAGGSGRALFSATGATSGSELVADAILFAASALFALLCLVGYALIDLAQATQHDVQQLRIVANSIPRHPESV